jgi:signal transduction histidine kinase
VSDQQIHSLLWRQLKRHFGSGAPIPPEWQGFIDTVNEAYRGFDLDRQMLERSLDLSSQELLQATSQIRAVFQAIPDLLFRIDRDGTILTLKTSSCDDLLLQGEELTGRKIHNIPRPGVGEQFRDAIARVRETRAVVAIEYSLEIGGRSHSYEARLVPAMEEQIVVIVRNITRQKQLEHEARVLSERRREFLEIQREFISMVSHEFRTPLTTIEGAHFLLEKLLRESVSLGGPAAEEAEKLLRLHASGLSTLGRLVDQVLVLNRIEHMTPEAAMGMHSPGEVLAETVWRFNDSMATPRVMLSDEAPAGFTASMDPRLVKTAAENLISNGLKYSGLEKPVRVRIFAEPKGWAVEVADQGRGIPNGDHARLFSPFFRAGNVGTVPGTGLGLAIVRRAVDFHGGRIAFESTENVGSSFKLHFPSDAKPSLSDPLLSRVPPI